MKEDYLWDGKGDPDPEVERLEQLLGALKYRERPLTRSGQNDRRLFAGVVAAAVVIIMAAGIWWMTRPDTRIPGSPPMVQEMNTAAAESTTGTDSPPSIPDDKPIMSQDIRPSIPVPLSRSRHVESPEIITPPGAQEPSAPTGGQTPEGDYEAMDGIPAIDDDLLALEVGAHLERVGLVLRSFKNTRLRPVDLAYESRRARALITTNMLLRRDAEAGGNLETEELLSNLETYLLDIANMRTDIPNGEVTSIKDRIQRKEVIVALQIHGY